MEQKMSPVNVSFLLTKEKMGVSESVEFLCSVISYPGVG